MARIDLLSNDTRLLERWKAALGGAGHTVHSSGRIQSPSICIVDEKQSPAGDLSLVSTLISHHPGTSFIVMAEHPNAEQGIAMLKAGVRGYCNRLSAPEVLVIAVTTVANGEVWTGKHVTDYLLGKVLDAAPESDPGAGAPDLGQLTNREVQIAHLVSLGDSNKVIAAKSGISERTVKAHLNAIFRKTGIQNRVQLALVMMRQHPEHVAVSNH